MSQTRPRQEIVYQVSQSLTEFADDYDIEAITDELIKTFDLTGDNPTQTIDDIDENIYWAIVDKHPNTTVQIGSFQFFVRMIDGRGENLPDVEEVELLDYIDIINANLKETGIYLSTDAQFYGIGEISDYYADYIRAAIIKADDQLEE